MVDFRTSSAKWSREVDGRKGERKKPNTIFLHGSHKLALGALQSVAPTTRKVDCSIKFLVVDERGLYNYQVEGWLLLFMCLELVLQSFSECLT